MTRFASILALVLALLPSAASAQEAQSISPGDRVRVSTMSGIRLTGKVLSLDAREINLMPDPTPVHTGITRTQVPTGITRTQVPTAVTRDTITRLEVSRGRGSRGKAVLIGALAGAAVGVALGFALGDNEGGGSIGFRVHSAEDKAVVGGVLLGSLGAIIGAAVRPERWATATPAPAYAVHTWTGRSLRFSFRF